MTKYNKPHYHNISSKATYRLRNYRLRSVLTICGPLAVLSLYVYICIYFLFRPPVNDVVVSSNINGNWIFYAWFLVSIFMLDWARVGLANMEACALMLPSLAPTTAMQLMWHSDGNWANPLWWLRAMRSAIRCMVLVRSDKASYVHSSPGGLWLLLSCVMLFLFVGVPLSGLSIQTAEVLCHSDRLAPIFGPLKEDFGFFPDGPKDVAQRIHLEWQSGRQTTPQRHGLLYAPKFTENVSTTYFDDQALLLSNHIETFVGPAVREAVTGRAWGIWANLSCNPTPMNALQLIRAYDYNNYSVNSCSTNVPGQCKFQWQEPSESKLSSARESSAATVPLYFKETAFDYIDAVNYSMLVAADGYEYTWKSFDDGQDNISPYFTNQGHDNCTMDNFRGRPQDSVTTAMFEIYLWESRWLNLKGGDPVMQQFIENPSSIVQIVYVDGQPATPTEGTKVPWAGFGIHCDVTTAAGTATVDPGHRQFSNFVRVGADSLINKPDTSLSVPHVSPAQVQALASMRSSAYSALSATNTDPMQDDWSLLSTWRVIQQSVGTPKVYLNLGAGDTSIFPSLIYPLLTPTDLQRSVYKLLGESLIALMDERTDKNGNGKNLIALMDEKLGVNGTYGELHRLRNATYIVASVVPWQYVLALLAIWALLTSGGGLWMMFYAKPRWAPTLNGFEMFKFGARYADEVDTFAEVDFQECSDALQNIPGMVGVLPGTASRSFGPQRKRAPYLIGLSEVSLGSDLQNKQTELTFNRKEAASTRFG